MKINTSKVCIKRISIYIVINFKLKTLENTLKLGSLNKAIHFDYINKIFPAWELSDILSASEEGGVWEC